MKITTDRSSLLAAVTAAAGGVATRTTKPVLTCLKAQADGDTLALTATDLEGHVRVTVAGVRVDREGECLLPAAKLREWLSAAADGECRIDADADRVKVAAGRGKSELPAYPVAEFPDPPALTSEHPVTVTTTAADLDLAFGRVAPAADRKDSTNFRLSGVLFCVKDGTLTLVATDSKRLSVHPVPLTEKPDGASECLVPPKAVKLFLGTCSGSEPVTVTLSKSGAVFATGRAEVGTRLIEGRFPPYRDIIGQSRKQVKEKIDVPAADVLAAVKQAATFVDAESKRLEFAFSPGLLVVSAPASGSLGTGSVECAVEYAGPGTAFALDSQYIAEFLTAVKGGPGGPVVLHAAGPDKPLLFRAGEFDHLIMPLSS